MSYESSPADELRWRIPTSGDPRVLKLALARVLLGTVVCTLVLLVAAPSEWLAASLVALLPLTLFLAYRQWRSHQLSLAGPDNVRLDPAGLHWTDPAGGEQTLPRALAVGFRIQAEPDTLRPVEALTLYLDGGFESQPIELHSPATAEAVRNLLDADWRLAERESESTSQSLAYDLAIDVYSECHEEHQQWHLEGNQAALTELFQEIDRAAEQLPLAPPGAKPAQRVLLLRRREASELVVARDRVTHVEHDRICGTAEVLAELARQGLAALESMPDRNISQSDQGDHDLLFELRLEAQDRWTFHLHVRPMV
jgi:hypothetical protein